MSDMPPDNPFAEFAEPQVAYQARLTGGGKRRRRRLFTAGVVTALALTAITALAGAGWWVYARIYGERGLGTRLVFYPRTSPGEQAFRPFLWNRPETSEKFGGEVYYKNGATKADAQKLGEYLCRIGVFAPQGNGATVQVVRLREWKLGPYSTYAVSFSLKEGAWDNPEVITFFTRLQENLAREVFPNHPVEIRLCNPVAAGLRGMEYMYPERTIP